MPELPDVEIFKNYFEKNALRKRIKKVEISMPRLMEGIGADTFKKKLKNRIFISASRHGKHFFAQTDNGGYVVLHFGMTGFFSVVQKNDSLPKHTRLYFDFEDETMLAYCCMRLLGKISWVKTIQQYIENESLGVDALTINPGNLGTILKESRSGLKSTLTDQSRIAGLGNIYSDEILFHAGLHPNSSCKKLSSTHIKKLHRSLHRVLKVAIRHKANPAEFPRGYLLPHREDGAKCPKCGSCVKKISSAGRSAYLCAQCQKKP